MVMVGWTIMLLAAALATAIYGSGQITGKPVVPAEFAAIIFSALFLVFCVGVIILWKAEVIKI